MPAIKLCETAVDKTGAWDGPKAVADAPNKADVLTYMMAWVEEKADTTKKSSYKFPHHGPKLGAPAVISGVNNALARLSQAKIPAGDRAGVEAHLRKHRKDAGLQEAMSEAEVEECVKFIKDVDDLKVAEAEQLREAIKLQEASNIAEWLESRLHLTLTEYADNMFGNGQITREERIALSGAIGSALDAYHSALSDMAPQLFQRGQFDPCPKPDGNEEGDGQMALGEAELSGEFVPLEEAMGKDGTVPIKIIQPGWGASGYYTPEVLQRDGGKAFPEGTKMFWNHPTASEESDRPERNLNDLAAVLTAPAQYDPKGPKGPGLYAKAKVFDGYQEAVNSLAKNIGLSIRAGGRAQDGEADGRQGRIITGIMPDSQNTVDFVTYPGAGGEVVTMFEAARTIRTDKKTAAGTVPAAGATGGVAISESSMEDDMTPEELKKLQESVAALQTSNETLATQNARMSEALVLRDAKDIVQETLNKIPQLPAPTRTRLLESLPRLAVIKEGKLDKDAFEKAVDEAIKAEVKYLTEAVGLGSIQGLGGGDQEEGDDEESETVEEALEGAFADLGLKETTAKIAAKGR